jgi:hypothetical protein
LLAAQVSAGPVQSIRIGPIDAAKADVTLVLAANTVKKCAGQFRGQLLLYEAAPAVNVSGALKSVAGVCEMATSVPWSGLSEQVFRNARADALQVRFRGELIDGKAARKVNWAVSTQRVNVSLTEPIRDTIKRFARATDLHLRSIGLTDSTVNADINLQSPLAFELRVLRATCELQVHGTVVATGAKESFVVAAGRATQISIPVTINHKALLTAAGNVFAQMGKVEGKLTGLIRLRLSAGDVDFPAEFPVLLKF